MSDAWVQLTCRHCGKDFRGRRCWVKRGQLKFCSHECSEIAGRKYEVKEYRGERYYLNKWGYYRTLSAKLLHRQIWEDHYGPIPDGYVIHHRDENKDNNTIENLELIEWGEHSALHNRLSPKTPKKPRKSCRVTACEQPHKAKGYCMNHYAKMKRAIKSLKETEDESRQPKSGTATKD